MPRWRGSVEKKKGYPRYAALTWIAAFVPFPAPTPMKASTRRRSCSLRAFSLRRENRYFPFVVDLLEVPVRRPRFVENKAPILDVRSNAAHLPTVRISPVCGKPWRRRPCQTLRSRFQTREGSASAGANPHRGRDTHGRSCGESRRCLEFSHLTQERGDSVPTRRALGRHILYFCQTVDESRLDHGLRLNEVGPRALVVEFERTNQAA